MDGCFPRHDACFFLFFTCVDVLYLDKKEKEVKREGDGLCETRVSCGEVESGSRDIIGAAWVPN